MFGQQRVVGASYYERAAGPLLLVILALMAAGPLLPWRRAARLPSLRALAWPGATALIAVAVLLVAGVGSIPALLALPLVAAVVAPSFMPNARSTPVWKTLPRPTVPCACRCRLLAQLPPPARTP